jgi:hypothetical protein
VSRSTQVWQRSRSWCVLVVYVNEEGVVAAGGKGEGQGGGAGWTAGEVGGV